MPFFSLLLTLLACSPTPSYDNSRAQIRAQEYVNSKYGLKNPSSPLCAEDSTDFVKVSETDSDYYFVCSFSFRNGDNEQVYSYLTCHDSGCWKTSEVSRTDLVQNFTQSGYTLDSNASSLDTNNAFLWYMLASRSSGVSTHYVTHTIRETPVSSRSSSSSYSKAYSKSVRKVAKPSFGSSYTTKKSSSKSSYTTKKSSSGSSTTKPRATGFGKSTRTSGARSGGKR